MTEMEPQDFPGLPFRDGEFSDYKPFKTFPLEDTPIPEGYKGWLIILEEFNSANEAMMASAYKLLLDHMVGQRKLHPKVFKIACGNLDSDNAIVNPMPTPVISRMAHYYPIFDFDTFMEWATERLDMRIIAFLNAFPKHANSFKPDATTAYSCPRTWHMLSDSIKGTELDKRIHTPLIASYVGDGIAGEFMSFLELFHELPKFEDIIANPETTPISNLLSVKWAVLSMVVSRLDETTAKQAEVFLKRMPLEMHLVALRGIKGNHPHLLKTVFRSWMLELAKEIIE